jgi:hypothetical protein
MAFVEDVGTDDLAIIALLHKLGIAESSTTLGIQFIELPNT